MARHRSPEGRRAHLGPPLSAALATAGAGGAYRPIAYQQSRSSESTVSMPVRFVATAIAGTALAATGQHLLVQAVPMASDGAAALRAGVDELLGSTPEPVADPDLPAGPITTASASTALVSEPVAAISPVSAEPVVVDASELVKAADLQRAAAESAAKAAQEEQARVAEQAQAEETRAAESRAAETAAASGGGVQLVDGVFTSGFGARNGTSHEGVDIAAPIGTPIHVPLAGTVIDSGPATGFGLWVQVEHEDGTVTTYGHINRTFVTVGQEVTAGEVIAEVGNRGQSSGPHLHFEVATPAGEKINPRPWLAEFGATV